MSSIETVAEFFGWCTLVSLGIYLATALALVFMRGWVTSFNAKLFKLDDEDISRASFAYLGHFKLAVTLLFFVPWLALTIMS